MSREQLAEKIKNDTEWNEDDCRELCVMAGIEDEWDNSFDREKTIYKAADMLGVLIYENDTEMPDYTDEAKDIVENGLYDTAVDMMDDDIRERLHSQLAPCTDEKFMKAYMEAYFKRYHKDFSV